ncbi:MAG TPA: ATP-binding protein [Solirubrobacterales bacterium]|jgi:anti-sigma regulatory factor (Ser/Thr protein kinase)|nr:ATP-binding protein [Solirubrobacterales bacterium]
MQTIHPDRLRADLPEVPARAGRFEFGLEDLHDVRSLVATAASAGGLPPGRASDLVIAASELAANSIMHGGGRGEARVWGEDGTVIVEVADAGTITGPMGGQSRPDPSIEHGRGLNIAGRLCDEMVIDSGPTGTRIRLRMFTAAG